MSIRSLRHGLLPGYNCMAIDQRSGGKINGVDNQTLIEALKASKDTGYPAAEQDIVAAVEYARKKIAKGKSFYGEARIPRPSPLSSPRKIRASSTPSSASPGGVFRRIRAFEELGARARRATHGPVLVMGAANERQQEEMIFDAIADSRKELFVPPVWRAPRVERTLAAERGP